MKYERKAGGSEVCLSFKFIKGGKSPGYMVSGTFKTKKSVSQVSFIWDPEMEMVVDLLMQDVGEGGSWVSEYRQGVFIDNILAHKEHLAKFLADEHGKELVEDFEEGDFVIPEVKQPPISLTHQKVQTSQLTIGKLVYGRGSVASEDSWYNINADEFVTEVGLLELLEELYKLNGGE